MKKLTLITLLLCFSLSVLFSQTTLNETFPLKQAVYVEGLGNYGLYSVNYEYKFPLANNVRLATGVGTSYLSQLNLLLVGVPANFIIGKKHSFEAGVNPICILGDATGGDLRTVGKDFILSLRAGYRYESNSGFLFRIAFTPLLDNDKTINLYPWGGISVGYCF